MIRLFITLLTLAAVGAAGAGAFTYIKHLKQEEFSAANTKAVFVELDTIYVPVARDGKLLETRGVTLSIETRAGGPHLLVLEQRARLQDAFMRYLYALGSRRGPENIDNIDYVRDQLRAAAGDVLGPNVVYEVLYKNIQQPRRPI